MSRHGQATSRRRGLWAAAAVVAVVALVAVAGQRLGGDAENSASAARVVPSVSSRSPDPEPTLSSSPAPTPSPTPTAEPEPRTAEALIAAVPVEQWRRMQAAEMAYRGCPLTRRDLRRVEVNYVSFDGDVRRGTVVVNQDVAASVARIFTRLFDARFPIARMQPVEEFGGDDNASMRANNTSGFNCRHPGQINAPQSASPHANGRAIDINPRQNPWMDPRCGCWFPSATYAERTPGKGVVRRGDFVWRAFRDEGWIWQNFALPDYMHFDTGFPSKPFEPAKAASKS